MQIKAAMLLYKITSSKHLTTTQLSTPCKVREQYYVVM